MRDISHLRHGVTWLTLKKQKVKCGIHAVFSFVFFFYFTSRQSTVLNSTQPYLYTTPHILPERTPAPPNPAHQYARRARLNVR